MLLITPELENVRYKYNSSNVNSKGQIGPKGIEGREVNSKGRKYKGEGSIKSKSTNESSIENGYRLNSTTPCNIDQVVLNVKSGAISKNRSGGPIEKENEPYIGDASRRNVSIEGLNGSRKSTKDEP